jgi:hypothetical protein
MMGEDGFYSYGDLLNRARHKTLAQARAEWAQMVANAEAGSSKIATDVVEGRRWLGFPKQTV